MNDTWVVSALCVAALVKVCLSTPGTSEIWKTIQFKLHYSSLEQAPKKPTHKVATLVREIPHVIVFFSTPSG